MAAIDQFQAVFETMASGATVRRFIEDSEDRLFSSEFLAGERINATIGSQSVHWKEERYSRGLARLTGPGDPTKAAAKPQQTQKAAVLIDVKENVDLPPEWLYLLQNPSMVGDNAVDNARLQYAAALQNLSQRIRNTVEYVSQKAMEGSLDLATVPNSELTGTITWPVRQLTALADWQLAATKIRSSEINRLVDDFHKNAGMRPARAIATKEVEGAIIDNDQLKAWLSEGSLAARSFETSFLQPQGGGSPVMGGLRWTFQNSHYALDSAEDTEIDFQTSDIIHVLPDEGMRGRVLALGQGYEMVPVGPIAAAGQDFSTVQRMMQPVLGPWAYLELSLNPVRVRLHAGWKFLPIVKIVDGVMAFDSTP